MLIIFIVLILGVNGPLAYDFLNDWA